MVSAEKPCLDDIGVSIDLKIYRYANTIVKICTADAATSEFNLIKSGFQHWSTINRCCLNNFIREVECK